MSDPGLLPVEITWTAPTPDQVAQLLRARTKNSSGEEVGAWTSDTRPTLAEINGIIATAVNDLASSIGPVVPDACSSGATGTAALLAAMLVELSYYPEQVRSDRSAYQEYKALYDGQVVALQRCVEAGGGGEGGGEGYTYYSLPVVPETTANFGRVPAGWWDTMSGPWGDLPGDHWPEPENPANWAQPFKPPSEPPLAGDLPVGDAPASGTVLDDRWP